MTKLLERHDIDDSLYVFLQDNSKRWYARFVLYGKWYCKSTKQTSKDKAIAMAHRIFLDHEIRIESGTLVQSKRFRDVAELCINKMKLQLDHGDGKSVYKDYIRALNNYHIPYFDRIYITSINQDSIRQFDKWRNDLLKRVPARSTLQTHNSALQMVFKEAIEQRWMLAIQVPVLNSNGAAGQRRASFSTEEYNRVFDGIIALEDNSHTSKTRQIRELLRMYVEFAVNTGIRPGTEMENITWGDITLKREDEKIAFFVHVRKGKTTKYTGTREVVCKDEIFDCLSELRDAFPQRKPKDKLFRLADGSSTNQLGKAFAKVLEKLDLDESAHGVRTLYSLRHSYITWQLMSGKVSIEVLAKQCGTSITMIEQHYSHVVPKMYANELSGVEFTKEKKGKKNKGLSRKGFARVVEKIDAWEREYKKRGCI